MAASYNDTDRQLQFCVDIYFEKGKPLRCLPTDYLVDCTLLEEACADSDTPVGTPSSNEVSFTLLSQEGMFNPLNANSPYKNLIKTGVQVNVFCRIKDLAAQTWGDWESLGTFYVSDWQTDVTGVTASVTAYDTLYNLLTETVTQLPITPNQSFSELITSFIEANGQTVNIVGTFTDKLSYGYVVDDNKTFLQSFTIGSFSHLFCDHAGKLKLFDIDMAQEVAHTLTDSDQIISITSNQSIVDNYDGVEMKYYNTQISDAQEILNVKEQTLAGGTQSYTNQEFSSVPVYAVIYTSITSENQIHLTTFDASSTSVSYTVTGTDGVFDIAFYGCSVDTVAVTLDEPGSNLLSVDSKYIQNEQRARLIKSATRKYVLMDVPYIELEIRGNPRYNIGEKLHIVSKTNNVDFTGILIRQEYKYDGGLTSTIKVMSSDVVVGG